MISWSSEFTYVQLAPRTYTACMSGRVHITLLVEAFNNYPQNRQADSAATDDDRDKQLRSSR